MIGKSFFLAGITLALTAPAAAQFNVSPPGATSTPPPAAALKAPVLPSPSVTTLPNGLSVITVRTGSVPLITAALVAKRGSASDDAAKLGTAQLAAAVMPAGTATRDAVSLSRAIDQIGAHLNARVDSDSTTLNVDATTDKFAQALGILADVARNATFPAKEIERARRQTLSGFEETYANIEELSAEASLRALFGAEGYGSPADGTPATVGAIGRSDLVAFRDAAFRPDNAILIIAGDIDVADAQRLAQHAFGSWPKPATPAQATAPAVTASTPRFIVIDKEDAGAGAIAAVMRAVPRTSPDYAAGTVANSVLSGYSGRLNEEVRVKRGLAYGANARFSALATDGIVRAYTLSVENPKIPQATDVVLAALRDLGTTPVAQGELDVRRRSYIGGRTTALQRERGVIELLSEYARYGLPLSGINTATASLEAITPGQVQTFATKYITQPTVVVIGKASVFLPELKAKYPNLEVVNFKDLDLSQPALKKP